MRQPKRAFRAGCFLSTASLFLLAGCSLLHPGRLVKKAIGKPSELDLLVRVVPGANSGSTIGFDVVSVTDSATLKQISQMSAAAWFDPVKGRCSYAGGGPKGKVQFASWELVNAQTYRLEVTVPADARAVLAFADYSSPGDHRLPLPLQGSQTVDLDLTGGHLSAVAPPVASSLPSAPSRPVCTDN